MHLFSSKIKKKKGNRTEQEQQTLFQKLLDLCDEYNAENNEFLFNRNPGSFNQILNYYRGGKLHFSDGTCAIRFSQVTFDKVYFFTEDTL